MQLAEGTQISLRGKVGEVYRSSPLWCELVWEEWIDLDTGEVVVPVSDKLSKDQIDNGLARGHLKILALPEFLKIQPPENGLVALTFRSLNSFTRPFAQMPSTA